MFAVIDCGSTNTRVYLIDHETIMGKSEVHVGVKDTTATGSTAKLKEGIKAACVQAAQAADVSIASIRYAIASGMITSDLGLLEVPHMTAPASVDDLAKQVMIVHDPAVFPLDIPVIFVRGIKNDSGNNTWNDVRSMDLMRGEETQTIGLLARLAPQLPVNIIELGSTTKFIHVDVEGRIAGSVTSLSGQVYDAVKKETFLGSCVREEAPAREAFFAEEIWRKAYECVQEAGFLRTLLLTRFIQFSMKTTAQERKFFMESAIAADDMSVLAEAGAAGFDLKGDYILVGHKDRCRLYETMIRHTFHYEKKMTLVTERADIDMLTVEGAIEIAKRSSLQLA